MNVSLTNVDSVNAIIQISIAKEDYQEKVDASIKNFRKKANVPGFRPGSVPVGMVKKMYGKSIIAEEVNKLVGESLYNYIRDNKLNVLGEPLPNEEKQPVLDFNEVTDLEFFFDVAIAPEIKLNLTQKDKISYYNIKVDKDLVEKQIDSYKANYGKYETVEEGAIATDLLKGKITELENGQPKEGGIQVAEGGVLMASYMKDETEQAKFIGAKKGDSITFNPGKAYNGNETEISSLLQIKKEQIETLAPEFLFEVAEITRYKEAGMNKELYDKVLGEGVAKNKTEFEEKVKDTIALQFAPDCDYKFLLDAKDLLIKKAGNISFPDALLKRWLLATSKERTEEQLETEYPKIIEDLTFHLIKEQIAKDNEIKIENSDVQAIALQAARAQFAQYGMMGLPEEMVQNYANDLLKSEDNARNLVDKAMENKIVENLKSTLGVEEKEIALDDFRKFFEAEEKSVEA